MIARGIERGSIFLGTADYADFLGRLGLVSEWCQWQVFAWALVPNHLHLVVRTGPLPLASAMRRLMTGYAVAFNRRHKRHGHLFQNRYKSILCDEEEYLLELVRYVGLNPFRAGLVKDLEELDRYPYGCHSVLMGRVERPWQATDEVLGRFGSRMGEARQKYREFVSTGLSQGHRPDLVGGGLVRSAGGWSEVLSRRQRKERMAADERVLGGGAFVEAVLGEAEQRHAQALRRETGRMELSELERALMEAADLEEGEIRTASRHRRVVLARRAFSQIAVRRLGYAGAEVARYLGVTTSCVNRAAGNAELEPLARLVLDRRI